MGNINPEGIISVLKSEIEDYENKIEVQEEGTVIQVGDGIATVHGLNHAMYGELVEFENEYERHCANLEMKTIGCVLLGSDHGLIEGSKVVRSGSVPEYRSGMLWSDVWLMRWALRSTETDRSRPTGYLPIEREAAGVIDRKSVDVPLETGILAIDAMFPIGRGQRELIIGDRQTGKTSIAVDRILNQKGKDVICVYVAIGQKRSLWLKLFPH